MKVKVDSSEWSAFDPTSTRTSAPLKDVDAEVRSTESASITTKIKEADKRKSNLLVDLAYRFQEIHERVERDTAELDQLTAEIAHYFPEEAGEVSKESGEFNIVVNRTERWVWDKKKLEEHFGEQELPPYVTRNLTVDKRKFQRLPHEDQSALKFALTRNLNSPRVKVIKNV